MANHVKKIIVKNKTIITSLLLNIMVLLVNCGFHKLHFLTNDDRRLLDIASGAYGNDTSQYLIFYNVLYGYILKGLFMCTRCVNWYIAIPICLSFISFCVIAYCTLELLPYKFGVTLCSIMIPILSVFHYLHFQWTHNAFLYCVVGLFAIYIAGHERITYSKVIAILGILLLLFGFMTRVDCLWATLPFALVVEGYYFLIEQNEICLKKRFMYNKRLLIYAGIAFILCFSAKKIDGMIYRNADSGGWEYHREYNTYRSNLWDYGGLHFADNQEAYEAIGINREAATLFDAGIWADSNQFDLLTLQKANDIRNDLDFDLRLSECYSNINRTLMTIRQRQTLPILVITIVLMLFSFWQKRKRCLVLFFLIMGFIAENLYLCYRGRVEARVIYGLLLILLIFTIATVSEQPPNRSEKKLNTFVLMFIGLIGWMLLIYENITYQNARITPEEKVMEFMTEASEDSEHLYLLDISLQQCINQEMPAVELLPKDFYSNLYFMGDWDVFTPRTDKILTRFEQSNAFETIQERKDVYLIDTAEGLEMKEEYIMNKYGNELNAYIDDALNENYNLYSFK